MLGKNELNLCQSEMAKAVQTYLNEHVFRNESQVVVEQIKRSSTYSEDFIVVLQSTEIVATAYPEGQKIIS